MQRHSPSTNLYSMLISVQKKLNDTSAKYWSVLEILNWLNEGQLYVARKAKCLEKEVAVTTTEGTREYDLKTTTNPFADIMDISESGVNFDVNGTDNQELEYKPIWALNKEFQGWRSVANSIPQYYYYKKASKTIGLYPEPNASNAGLYLHINGYYKPKVLIAGTASSGSTTTLVMPAGTSTLPYPNPVDDYYNNLYVEIYSGTGAGQKLKITDYTASLRTLTFATATSPDSSSTFGLCPEIEEEAQNLMYLWAMAKALEKGSSRVALSDRYFKQFFDGLSLFMGETVEADSEILIKDSYR